MVQETPLPNDTSLEIGGGHSVLTTNKRQRKKKEFFLDACKRGRYRQTAAPRPGRHKYGESLLTSADRTQVETTWEQAGGGEKSQLHLTNPVCSA